jgi:DUF1680 family protein
MKRRDFLACSGAAALSLAAQPQSPTVSETVRPAVRPFPLGAVVLRTGPFQNAAGANRRYLASLDPERLLLMFRRTAGLASNAEPLGGWEAPENELRGHFTGHYLTACAQLSAAREDEFRRRGNHVVAELAKCQQAHRNGYLSAFPEDFFDRLRQGEKVWAPFYTLHKIMAGLLDMHVLAGNEQALDVAKGMAQWTGRWARPLSEPHMNRILDVEFGGMNDVLYDLAARTRDEAYMELGHRFDHERIFAPLAARRDELKGLHVNTQIPKIIGAARRYELTGESRYRDIALFFHETVTGNRSYCTGGTSNDERWGSDPGKLAHELSGYTQECCCTYNLLKLTRHLFSWTADPRYADYYERALFNGILGTIHPADGMTIYYVPLATGYWKLFGLPLAAFWCCTGTGVESFSKLADSIYFHDGDGIYVNLFIASELHWKEKGVRVVQDTKFPESDSTTLTIRAGEPVRMALRVRVPYWTGRGGSIAVNGTRLDVFASPSSYLTLDRTWKDGDKVELRLPMSLNACPMPDDQTMQAFMYGPLVLAGQLGAEGLTPDVLRAEPTKPYDIPHYRSKPVSGPSFRTASSDLAAWIKPGAKPLEFRTAGQERNLTLEPLYKIIDQRYGVYWKVERG